MQQRSSKKPTTPGRVNLFHDFNSPAVPSNVATPGVVRQQFDSSHTQKLTYAKIAASSPTPGTPVESVAIDYQSHLPKTPPVSELLSSNNNSLSAASTSPSTSSIQSNSTTGTSLAVNATSTDVPETIAPSEYVIEFPPGPLHLKFDPVVYTLGKPMGCCVSQILPEFNTDLSCIRMEGVDGAPTNAGAAATIIQVNDLIVSINGTNVLSRKFDVISDLLHKLHGSHKTIVFRSIEKVWKSQFQRKTMRNLRSGKRVATALSTGEMERNLHSWVETPTKVEVGSRGDRRNVAAIGDKLESITEMSSSNEVQTPRGDTGSRMSSMDLFSPSNVKKVMLERSGDGIELVLSTTPKASPNQGDDNVIKSNITAGNEYQGSAAKTSKQSPINQISQALVGGNNSEQEFERSLRLKKSVLKELNGVCLELGERYFSDEEEAAPKSEAEAIVSESVIENSLHAADQVLSKDVDSQVSLLKERVRELTSALATAEDEAREREDDLEDRLLQLQSQLSSQNVAAHEEEVRRLKEENELAVKEVQQQLEKERAFFQERVAKGKKSKQELIGKLDATQSELEKNKALCASLEKKNMSKKEMKAKLKSSSTLIQSLQTEKGQLATELQTLQQNLSERDDSDKEKQAELEQKALELEKMVEEVAILKSERDAANKEKEAELESLSSSLTEKAVELEKMVEEVSNLKHHLSLSEKKGSADRVALKANKSMLVEECEQLKAQLEESDKVRDDLHAKVDEHEIELARRQTLLNDVKKRNYSLQEMIDELNETLERSGNDASEQVGFLERKLQMMKQELEEARSTSTQYHDDAKRIGEEKREMQEQLAKVTKELEENRVSRLEKEKLSSENEFLAERVGELTESLAKAENDAMEREGFLEKKLQIANMELDETRSASNMRQDEIQRLKKEKQIILEDADSKYNGFQEQMSAKEDEVRLLNKQAEDERLSLIQQLEKENSLKIAFVHKLEATQIEHAASLSRRQELLDDMEKHNALLKQRVGELTDCLATSEDDAREREDALEEKLKKMGVELEEAKLSYNQKYSSQMEELKRVEAEKEATLNEMREYMEVERASFNERVEREERSKAEVMAELDSTGKHNALLKQRISELTDCLAKAEDDAREREDALEEKLMQIGIEFEEAKIAHDQKFFSQMEDLKRLEVENEATLKEMREMIEIERASFSDRMEREERSKAEVMAELEATKDDLINSEASNTDLECRLKDVQTSMETKISELTCNLEKAYDDAREREDALQEELYQLGKKVDEAKVTANQNDAAHEHEIHRIEDEKRELLNENTKFQEQLESLVNQIEMGENTKNDLQGRVDALDRAKAFHEKSLTRRQELLDDMEARNTFLKQRVDELTDCVAKAEDDAREREDALEEKLLQMGAEFETVKSMFNNEKTAHTDVIHRLEEEKKELASQISSLGHEADDLKEQISVLKSTNFDTETQLHRFTASNTELEDQVKELSEKFSNANQDADRSKALCADLRSKLETAERLLDESDAEMNTLSYDCDCLEKQVDNLSTQLESQQEMIMAYEGQIKSLRNEIGVLTNDKKSLSEDLESHMAKVLLSEDDKSDLEVRIKSLAADLKTAEAEKLQLLSERDSLKCTADERLTLLQKLEEKTEIRQSELLDSLTAKEFEIASLTSHRGEIESNLDDLGCRFNQLKGQSKKESESFKNRQDQLLNEISTVNAQNEIYLTQIRSLEASIGRIKAQFKKEKETHEKTERQLLMDVRNSQNSISGAKLKHSHVEKEVESIKSQLNARESEISKFVDEKERLDTELRDALLKADAEVKASAISQNEHAITVKKLEADVEREQALSVDLTSRLETLTLAMNSKEKEVNRLKHELSCAAESMRLLKSEEKMSKSTLESKLIDTRSQFEAERKSLKERISQLEADASESQQNLLAEKTASIETEAHLSSQIEIIKAELSNAKRIEDDLREQLNDVNSLLKEKNFEIEELSSDVFSEKEDRRQELFEMKCLYEKKIQELTTSSLDIEAEKSILETRVERLTQDIAVSGDKESSDANRIQDLEQLLQRQNEELLKVSGDMTASTAAHENALSEMEKNYAWNVEELKELHDAERSELIQQMSDISDELRLCQEKLNEQIATQEDDKLLLENDREMIDELRVQLEEGITLNDSLSTNLKGKDHTIEVLRQDLKRKEESLIAADRNYQAKIEEMKSSHAAEKQNLVDEIEKFSSELDWSLDQIDKRQSIIDSQRLSLNDENNELVRELSKANDTEMKLRKLLHETHMEVQQISVESATMRSDIVAVIDAARNTSKETLQQAAQSFRVLASKWVAEKASYEDKINILSEDANKLRKQDKHLSSQVVKLQSSLEERGHTIEELSAELISTRDSLRVASVQSDRAKHLASRVEELQLALESRDKNVEDLSIQLTSAKEDLFTESEESQRVSDNLECVMNQLDEMVQTNEELQEEICKLENAKQHIQSLYDSEKDNLQSEIDSILADGSDKLVSVTVELDAVILTNEKLQREISELEIQKQLCQDTFETEKADFQSRIESLVNDVTTAQDELCQTRANVKRIEQERDSNVETALNDLDDAKLKNELLLDEIAHLKSVLQGCHQSFDSQRVRYESNIASLSTELKSSSERFEAEKESFKTEWRHFQLLLKHLVDSIDGEIDVNDLNSSSDSAELPDIASQLGTLIKLVGKKEESILQLKSQIESLEFDLRDARIVRDRLIHHDQVEEDLETSRFLSEIEEAKVKVIGMDRRLVSERSKRKDLETQLSVEGKNQAMIKEELSKKENTIDELEETVQLKLVEIERLESQLCRNDDLREKLEGKYEEAKSELETYHNLATELKQTIIDKVSPLVNYNFFNQVPQALTFSPLCFKTEPGYRIQGRPHNGAAISG